MILQWLSTRYAQQTAVKIKATHASETTIVGCSSSTGTYYWIKLFRFIPAPTRIPHGGANRVRATKIERRQIAIGPRLNARKRAKRVMSIARYIIVGDVRRAINTNINLGPEVDAPPLIYLQDNNNDRASFYIARCDYYKI